MATAPSTIYLSVDDYLHTSFRPDVDYVDDHIEERVKGEREHSDLQRKLILLLSAPACENLFVCNPELRVQVSGRRFRLPDLCLIATDAPYENVVRTPPLLCIEILSPEDTIARTMVRVQDFLRMGVPAVWVFDTTTRTARVCTSDAMTEHSNGLLTVPGTDAAISITAAFSVLRPR